MGRSSIQRLIAVLCLLAFGLGQTVFAFRAVRCTDASGTSRVEYQCVKSDEGACLTSVARAGAHEDGDDHSSDPGPSRPCEDEPLGAQASAVRLSPSTVVLELAFAAVAATMLWESWSFTGDGCDGSPGPCRERDRPPDALARLRSVILVV